MIRARFDDVSLGGGRSFTLVSPVDEIVADDPGQVLPALHAVERAVGSGLWAGGYVAYEAAPGFDPALQVAERRLGGPPLLWFGLFRGSVPAVSYPPRSVTPAPYHISRWRTSVGAEAHASAVDSIRRSIEDGDSYQVNFTFRLDASFSGDAEELYRDLLAAQRGAFGAYLDTGRFAVASASPELFYSRTGDRIETRPMKGTIRRGRWAAEDRLLAEQLRASEKDRAENLMIVDLLRNDMGRIAEFGSVEVDELFALERYETLWQLTSRISARTRPGTGVADIFRALFPSGSVTGAPKASTMEIIAGLEGDPRGVYCGSVGYVAPTPDGGSRSVFNVAIRTVTVDHAEGTAVYGTGGGITWDSLTGAEYAEARLKAQLLVERRPEFSLVETMRFEPGSGVLFEAEHMERLAESAWYFGFAVDVDAVAKEVSAEVEAIGGPQRIRVAAGREGCVEIEAVPLTTPFQAGPGGDGGEVVRFAVSDDPVSSDNRFLFHKTTLRSVYDDRLKRHPGADEVLLVNERDEITEFTIGNVALLLDGVWWTPPLASGCLPGVMRRVLLEQGVLHERVLTVEDVEAARAAAFINSVRGWRLAVLAEADWEAEAAVEP